MIDAAALSPPVGAAGQSVDCPDHIVGSLRRDSPERGTTRLAIPTSCRCRVPWCQTADTQQHRFLRETPPVGIVQRNVTPAIYREPERFGPSQTRRHARVLTP